MIRLHKLLLTTGVALSLVAPAAFGEVPLPAIPEAKGEQCVEDTTVMRKRHMDFLVHQRDETMHRGIRTEKHSLKACLDCHVPADTQVEKDGHFCMNCHQYAGVSIDCFQCHSPMPEDSAGLPSATLPGSKLAGSGYHTWDSGQTEQEVVLNQLTEHTLR